MRTREKLGLVIATPLAVAALLLLGSGSFVFAEADPHSDAGSGIYWLGGVLLLLGVVAGLAAIGIARGSRKRDIWAG